MLAYKKARKGKRWQRNVQKFELNVEGNLKKIQEILVNKTFRTSKYKTKVIYEPKQRDIYILPFYPDRIIQHAVMNIVEPLWDKMFISDSYSCRKGKGIHKGSQKTMEFVRKNSYCLKCDISKFYPSMNHDILFSLVKQKIKCHDTLWLLHDIIYSFPGKTNVPIGNYTSQWFGNLYMNELDKLVKQKYRVEHYIRYCDDFILFHNDKEFLSDMNKAINRFLKNDLQLTMSKCAVFPTVQGVDFLGYRHFPKGYILLRKSTVKRIRKRLKGIPHKLTYGYISYEQARSSLVSTSGWLQWANTYNLRTKLMLNNLLNLYGRKTI